MAIEKLDVNKLVLNTVSPIIDYINEGKYVDGDIEDETFLLDMSIRNEVIESLGYTIKTKVTSYLTDIFNGVNKNIEIENAGKLDIVDAKIMNSERSFKHIVKVSAFISKSKLELSYIPDGRKKDIMYSVFLDDLQGILIGNTFTRPDDYWNKINGMFVNKIGYTKLYFREGVYSKSKNAIKSLFNNDAIWTGSSWSGDRIHIIPYFIGHDRMVIFDINMDDKFREDGIVKFCKGIGAEVLQ